MLLSMKRKRIERERQQAVGERSRATREFIAALREAEAALDAIRAANDKFYRSEVQHEQAGLSELRRSRERMFAFVTAKEVASEAPLLTRLLCVRVAPTQAMPMAEWIDHTGALDLASLQPATKGEAA